VRGLRAVERKAQLIGNGGVEGEGRLGAALGGCVRVLFARADTDSEKVSPSLSSAFSISPNFERFLKKGIIG